jgi:hypothetical protein
VAETQTYTQEQVDAMIAERLAAETDGLKKSQRELLAEAKKAKDTLKNYDGVDPDEFKRLKAAAEEAERKKATAEGDFKSLEKQLIEKHTAELGAEKGKTVKYQSALEKYLVQAQLTAAIAKHKGDPDLLLPHAAQHVRVRETDEGFEAYVADDKGNPRIADGKGTPMSFDDLVTQVLAEKYPRAFDGAGSSGGGASKSTGGAGGTRVIPAGDNGSFIANLDGIAKGTVKVAA